MKEHIQCRLLTLEDLTLAKAYKTAQGMETAEQHASELQASTKPSGTEAVQIIQRSQHCKTSGFTTYSGGQRKAAAGSTSRSSGMQPCYRCGKATHTPDKYYYRNQHCHSYWKLGHLARQCRSGNKATHLVMKEEDTAEGEEDSEDGELPLFNIKTVTTMMG